MSATTKIIFLDIDGVCTSARTGWGNFDLYAVNFLRWACEKSGARIVISSTWRSNHSLGFFRQIFGDYIFREGDWKTPHLETRLESGLYLSKTRGDEIAAWLQKHPPISDYLILDDDSDFTQQQKKKLIKTDSCNGILFDDMMKIRDYFGIETFPKEITEFHQHPNMFETRRRAVGAGDYEK